MMTTTRMPGFRSAPIFSWMAAIVWLALVASSLLRSSSSVLVSACPYSGKTSRRATDEDSVLYVHGNHPGNGHPLSLFRFEERKHQELNSQQQQRPRRRLIFWDFIPGFADGLVRGLIRTWSDITDFLFGWIFSGDRDPPTTVGEAIAAAQADIGEIVRNDDSLAAKFLRLAFHSCVGGCDGCVDLNNPDNNGLQLPLDLLKSVVEDYAGFLTRADVYVLAGLEACQVAIGFFNGQTSFDMELVGRPVCDDPEGFGPPQVFPGPNFVTQEVLDYFAETFNFSTRETTAIIGAHTLGTANRQNSGFETDGGAWAVFPNRLDHEFYKTFHSDGSVNTKLAQNLQENTDLPEFPPRTLWREPGDEEFLLNSDMALAVNFAGFIDAETGTVSCSLGSSDSGGVQCPTASETLSIANEYLADNQLWLDEFHDALLKMFSTGCDETVCTPP